MSVLIVDYGMGNLGSVRRALEECGVNAFISSDPDDVVKANHIVLPGVGSFSDGMKNLNGKKWTSILKNAVQKDNIPILGICLGMHLLADVGYENGETEGIGLIPGEVRPLQISNLDERIPHVGWNEVSMCNESSLFENIPINSDFYFVHSYHFTTSESDSVIATTSYCGGFASAIEMGIVAGVQFHPEKSSHLGFQLLSNFLSFF